MLQNMLMIMKQFKYGERMKICLQKFEKDNDKSILWMPWRIEAKKDVPDCEKFRGAVKKR